MRFQKNVNGLIGAGENCELVKAKLTVRGTADSIGKTLTIADDKSGIIFMIPLEAIQGELKEMLKR